MGKDAKDGASAAQGRSEAADDWRKGWEEDKESAQDCEASIAEVRPYQPDPVKFPPDLQLRVSLALGRIENDACWATARKHPKFSRLYTLASIGSMCLDYAAGALEYLNAGPLTEKGKRKFDRAVSAAERMAQEIEQSGELKALLAKAYRGRIDGANTTKAMAEAERGWTDRELVDTFNGFFASRPGRAGKASSVRLTIKHFAGKNPRIDINPHKVNLVLRQWAKRQG